MHSLHVYSPRWEDHLIYAFSSSICNKYVQLVKQECVPAGLEFTLKHYDVDTTFKSGGGELWGKLVRIAHNNNYSS